MCWSYLLSYTIPQELCEQPGKMFLLQVRPGAIAFSLVKFRS